MKKNIGMLLGLAAMSMSMVNSSTKGHNDGSYGHGVPDEKPEIIPNGCQKYTFYGHTVIAISKKSAKKKCAKLAKLNSK